MYKNGIRKIRRGPDVEYIRPEFIYEYEFELIYYSPTRRKKIITFSFLLSLKIQFDLMKESYLPMTGIPNYFGQAGEYAGWAGHSNCLIIGLYKITESYEGFSRNDQPSVIRQMITDYLFDPR